MYMYVITFLTSTHTLNVETGRWAYIDLVIYVTEHKTDRRIHRQHKFDEVHD